jgi:hypothetical protein
LISILLACSLKKNSLQAIMAENPLYCNWFKKSIDGMVYTLETIEDLKIVSEANITVHMRDLVRDRFVAYLGQSVWSIQQIEGIIPIPDAQYFNEIVQEVYDRYNNLHHCFEIDQLRYTESLFKRMHRVLFNESSFKSNNSLIGSDH